MDTFFRYAMALLYIAAGINHFVHPDTYMRIMPPYIPWHREPVAISGIFEVASALLLLPAATRRIGAWLIIMLLVAVFPANIQMAIDYYHAGNPQLWLAILRLPLQPLLIWWAWLYTHK